VSQHPGGVAVVPGAWAVRATWSWDQQTCGDARKVRGRMDVTSMGEGDGMAYQDGFKQNFTGLDPLAALRKPTICYASPPSTSRRHL
jgi:hypothetical protein